MRDLMRRGATTFAAVAAVCLMATPAAFAQYKFKVVISSAQFGGATYQACNLNNNGQFSFNIVGSEVDSGGGGETTYVWDGTAAIRLQPTDTKLSDGSSLVSASHWSPHGINDAGKVAFVADTDNSPHAIVVYSIADKAFTLIAKNDTVVEGGTLTSAGVALEGRMVCDINNKDQIVWSEGLTPADGSDPNDAVFMFDPAANKVTTLARKGTALPGGKTILNALFPDIGDDGAVVFMANTADDENFGIYQWANGNITVICAPGTQVDGVTVAQAKLPRNSDVGHVVFRGETVSSGGAAPVADDTGYFMFSAGKLTKIIAPGDALPGGKKFVATEAGGGRRSVGVNDSGLVAFKAVMENDESGIYLWKDGTITPMLTSGQSVEAAGTVESTTQGAAGSSGYHMGINDHGDVLFSGVIDGANVFVLATAPR
jgi:hypothetical protein